MAIEHLSQNRREGFGAPTHTLLHRTWAENHFTGGRLWDRRSVPVRIRSSCSISLAWPKCVSHKCTCVKWQCVAGSEDKRSGRVNKAQVNMM